MGTQVQPLANSSEANALAAARRGSPDAFAELIRPFAHALYRRALRLTGSVDDAEEIRQDALLRAFARLHQFHGTASAGPLQFRAWTGRIASNLSIDRLRQRRASRIFHCPDTSGEGETDWIGRAVSPCADPEELYALKEMRLRLAAAIEHLPPDLRIVCVLRDVFQYSTHEVSRRLRISNVAVRLRLFRAHTLLRERLRSVRTPRKPDPRGQDVSMLARFSPLPHYSGD